MNNDNAAIANESPAAPSKPRIAPAIVLVALFWAFFMGVGLADLPNFTVFMARFAALGVLILAFTIWYLVSRNGRPLERLAVIGMAALGGVIAIALLDHPSVIPPAVLFY